jgi:hypothetical protein
MVALFASKLGKGTGVLAFNDNGAAVGGTAPPCSGVGKYRACGGHWMGRQRPRLEPDITLGGIESRPLEKDQRVRN